MGESRFTVFGRDLIPFQKLSSDLFGHYTGDGKFLHDLCVSGFVGDSCAFEWQNFLGLKKSIVMKEKRF